MAAAPGPGYCYAFMVKAARDVSVDIITKMQREDKAMINQRKRLRPCSKDVCIRDFSITINNA